MHMSTCGSPCEGFDCLFITIHSLAYRYVLASSHITPPDGTVLFEMCFSLKIVLILRKWSSKRLIQALDTPELAEWYFFL